jgi:hypothetical protein
LLEPEPWNVPQDSTILYEVLCRCPLSTPEFGALVVNDRLFCVSRGSSVPPEDQQVTFATDPGTQKLLDVRPSKWRSHDAFVAIHYRNH